MDKANKEQFISLRGVRVNNLKNIDVDIPRNKFVVVSGLSGSGKSSLVHDTIYAEGQRRYVESLSAYARQFLSRMNKPEVDFIQDIPPAIAVEQKVSSGNSRSTVGTATEIYDFLKLLFSRIGITYSPVSGDIVRRDSVSDVVDWMEAQPSQSFLITYPLKFKDRGELAGKLSKLLEEGSTRIEYDDKVIRISTFLEDIPSDCGKIYVICDKVFFDDDIDTRARIQESVQSAFSLGEGYCRIVPEEGLGHVFSTEFERDGIIFEEPSEHLFSFNNPYGACPKCNGFGMTLGIDENLVIPDKTLSVYEEAVACWRGDVMKSYLQDFIMESSHYGFPIHRPYKKLTDSEKDLLWNGNSHVCGINDFFKFVNQNRYKIQYRVMAARYQGKTVCPICHGARLRKEADYVRVNGKTISQLTLMPVSSLVKWFDEWTPNPVEAEIAGRLVEEIRSRLSFMTKVGLGYLTLNRLSSSLSGGETQRINLATSLGSTLVGSMYILDEPSIGLHSKDTGRLIDVLRNLRDLGNTIIVVEHDQDIISAADHMIDIGPYAGRLGGEVVFSGSPDKLEGSEKSLTAAFLSGRMKIELPSLRRKWTDSITVHGASENNLKNIDVRFPLNVLCVVSGVSGSGKTTLVNKILYRALVRKFEGSGDRPGSFDSLSGDFHKISKVEYVGQGMPGRSSRSNPVTYCKAFDEIRKLFSETPAAKLNGLKASDFSFNVEGGRCEECQGEGVIRIPMQFMADVVLECEHCHGKKYKQEILDVIVNDRTISDVLDMSVDEAVEFFSSVKGTISRKIVEKLTPLKDVGLGYIKLGQSSSSLSGGECQRLRLSCYLGEGRNLQPSLFIFDEPTTGLHMYDVNNLLKSLNALLELGHSIIVVEHNLDVIKSADWVIDMGPEGGDQGGQIVCEGTPETVATCKESRTGVFLAGRL